VVRKQPIGSLLHSRKLVLSSLKIPIQMHPGKPSSEKTFSFHHPLSHYMQWIKNAGLAIVDIQEWISDKKSEGVVDVTCI